MLKKIMLFLIGSFLIFSLNLYAGDNEYLKAKISGGYHGYSINDHKGRVAEYESTKSGPDFKVNIKENTSDIKVDINSNYKDVDDHEVSINIDLSRILKIDMDYNQFIHRLDHDELYAPFIKKSQSLGNPQFKIPVGVNNDPSDPQPDSYKLINYPDYNSIVAWETHGPKAFRYTDLNVGRDYLYHIKRIENNFTLQIPTLPNIILHGGYNYQNKTGHRQVMTMKAHCATCHIQSRSQKIDEATQIWNIGGTIKVGILTLDFTHKYKKFTTNNEDVSTFYELSHHPPAWDPQYGGTAFPPPGGEEGTFGNRLNFQYQTLPFAKIPENKKASEIVKARIDLTKNTHVTGMYVYSKTTDTDRTEALNKDLDLKYQSIFGRLTTHPSKKLTITAGVKYYTIDADDIYVRDKGGAPNPPDSILPNPNSHWGYDNYISADPTMNFSYNRKSIADRDVTEFDISANYNFNYYATAKIEYRLKYINRDNGLQYWENRAALTDAYNTIALNNADKKPVPADYQLDEYDYGDPKIHTIEGSLYFYPKANLNGRFDILFEYNKDPFEYPHAKGEKIKALQSALSPNFCFDPIAGKFPNVANPDCTPPGCVCVHGASSSDIGNSSNYADFFVPQNRIEEGTNQPSKTYKTELSLNWTPTSNGTTSISSLIGYSYQKNDDTPWKSRNINFGLNSFWSVTNKLNFMLSYNFYHERTTTDYWFTFFNG